MKNNNGLLILAGGSLLAYLLLRKKDAAGAKPTTESDNSKNATAVTPQPVVNYAYNEYNTYEKPNEATQEAIIMPPAEDQSQIKVLPAEPVYNPTTETPADFPTLHYEETPYKSTVVTSPTPVKTEPTAPAPTVLPSSIREQSTVLTASVKGINGTIRQCMVRPNLGSAVHRASRVIYINTGSQVKVYAVSDNQLLREYGNYGFHIVTQ